MVRDSRLRYVWASKSQPHAGIEKGDHLLIVEVLNDHQIIERYWTDPDGQTWTIYPNCIVESRWEGFLVSRGPETLGFAAAVGGLAYLIYHVFLWAT